MMPRKVSLEKPLLLGVRALVLLLWASSLHGSSIDISGLTRFTLQTGDEIAMTYGVWNLAYNNPGYSPYPNNLTFLAIFTWPANPTPVPCHGGVCSTGQYFPGYEFQVTLESADGQFVMPMQDQVSTYGYLPQGTAWLGRGAVNGIEVGVIHTWWNYGFPGTESPSRHEIFGPEPERPSSRPIQVRIRNTGLPVTLGWDNIHTIGGGNVLGLAGVTGDGPVSVGGVTGQLTYTPIPEPGTLLLCAPGVLVLIRRWLTRA